MTRYKSCEVMGVVFQGVTLAECKATAARELPPFIEEARTGPSYHKVRDLAVIVWPHLNGWSYTYIRPGMDNGVLFPACQMGGTRASAVASAVGAICQYQWTLEVENDSEFLDSCFAGLTTPEADARKKDNAYLFAWQRRLRVALDLGVAMEDSRDIATRTSDLESARKWAAGMVSSVVHSEG